MTEKELEKQIYIIANRFEKINVEYLTLMGKHIKGIGKLSPSDVHRLEQMLKMGTNVDIIRNKLLAECNKTENELDLIINQLIKTNYKDNEYLFALRNKHYKDLASNEQLIQYLQSIKTLTNNTMKNMAHTTVLDEQYKEMIDMSIQAVSSGIEGYNTTISKVLKSYNAGARVKYSSGITRRLDSAVRMNLFEGTRQIYDEIRKQSGDIFGADGYEVDAHGLCAADHINIQGRQFSKYNTVKINGVTYEPFDKVNSNLVRPIGTCNCRHKIFPIVLGISKPNYTNNELERIKNSSNKKIMINDKEYTRYECTQLLRQAETSMRYTKDRYILARATDNEQAMDACKLKLQAQKTKYKEIAYLADIPEELWRAYVPGFINTK